MGKLSWVKKFIYNVLFFLEKKLYQSLSIIMYRNLMITQIWILYFWTHLVWMLILRHFDNAKL